MVRIKEVAFLKRTLFIFWIGCLSMGNAKINYHELRCEVCKRTVEEMVKDVEKVDPDKKIHIGEFMLDHKGDRPSKLVELRRSEVYLTELMERVCEKMDNYVRAVMKDTGKLVVIPLLVNEMMNPIIGEAQIIQDSDLNRSLKFYCENIVEEYDEGFVQHFGVMASEPIQKVCWEYSKLCRETYAEEYEEDIVAAEKKKAKRKKKSKKKKKKQVDRKDMTHEERMIDDISHLPITGPDYNKIRDDDYETDNEEITPPKSEVPNLSKESVKEDLTEKTEL